MWGTRHDQVGVKNTAGGMPGRMPLRQRDVSGDVEHCVNQLAGLIRDHALTDIVTGTVPPDMRVAT
jgi:hypothetical protein